LPQVVLTVVPGQRHVVLEGPVQMSLHGGSTAITFEADRKPIIARASRKSFFRISISCLRRFGP
jgi:hypothetical protein